jgi:hypothetical protein
MYGLMAAGFAAMGILSSRETRRIREADPKIVD